MNLFKILLCLLLTSFTVKGQSLLNDTGLLASKVNSDAPSKTENWGKLVGNWDVVFESIDEFGEIQQTFQAEWNWFYILNGHAIQDVFILPPKHKAPDINSIFYGVGIRIFDEDSDKWQSVWVDTSNKKLEFREARSSDKEIVMYQTNITGERLRITYFNMTATNFEWRQETFKEDNKSWILTQKIHATKK